MASRYEHYTDLKMNRLCPFWFGGEENGYSCPSNWHSNIEILLVTEGSGAVQYGKRRISLTEGDIVVVNSGVLHRLYSDVGISYNFTIIDDDFCRENGINTSLINFDECFRDEGTKTLFENCIECRKAYSKLQSPIAAAKLRSAILALLIDVAERHSLPEEMSADSSSPSELYVKRAIEYVNDNYTHRITLDEIASLCGITKFHLGREFKRMTGQSLFAYLNTLRCKQAQTVLDEGKTVTEAALESGFESLSYFSRTYKKLMGVSPSSAK